ncbi:uncharacterized protein PHACADRAFT_204662 [Phanerochaete carnosa HHB-10118-sp]|uniref:Uncharacterized protein n=1 Tax=Phanerochaete carnosa (strain HHB-10118-sp) TaxID=650164 RepID=K5WC21_PHACS|nr:uncharacterized protein PHACADRAFT_204662 [Phanerochaete carnosa HHB-10118-sp]EKM61493.1 hypothetical protein PHACADRAFT_204662 [Phanerochaete carnosa HHB-10118-sp]
MSDSGEKDSEDNASVIEPKVKVLVRTEKPAAVKATLVAEIRVSLAEVGPAVVKEPSVTSHPQVAYTSDEETEDDRSDTKPANDEDSKVTNKEEDLNNEDDNDEVDLDAILDEMGLESRAPADRTTVVKRVNAPPRPVCLKRSSSDSNLRDSKPKKKAKKTNTAPPDATTTTEPSQRKGEDT